MHFFQELKGLCYASICTHSLWKSPNPRCPQFHRIILNVKRTSNDLLPEGRLTPVRACVCVLVRMCVCVCMGLCQRGFTLGSPTQPLKTMNK